MKIIGCTGVARSGKDTYCGIAMEILNRNGISSKKYSFADELKREVAGFLQEKCGVDVWTNITELKTDIRDFLVWYGTTFWRKRDPEKWIKIVNDSIEKDNGSIDVGFISDVRYPNEGDWIHNKSGKLIHISSYKLETTYEFDYALHPELDGVEHPEQYFDDYIEIPIKRYLGGANTEERNCDPILRNNSDFKVEWETRGLTPVDAINHNDFRIKVLNSLNASNLFTEKLSL